MLLLSGKAPSVLHKINVTPPYKSFSHHLAAGQAAGYMKETADRCAWEEYVSRLSVFALELAQSERNNYPPLAP